MALNIQRIIFDPIGGDSVTAAFRKLDLDIGELANAIDGDGSPSAGISNRLASAENKLAGLGNSSVRNVGTTAGSVAAGDDPRLKVVGTVAGTLAAGDDARITGAAPRSYVDASFMTMFNPVFNGASGINKSGIKYEYTFRVNNGGTSEGIGGAYAEWAGNLTPALQVDCQSAASHYMGIRWTHWGVRHLAAIHAYEGGENSPVTILGFHIAGKTNSHVFDSNGNAFFAGVLQQNSDYRIKDDRSSIEPRDTADKLRRLKPITYADNRRPAGDPRLAGLLAHELQEQFPLLVDGEKDAVRTETIWMGDATPYLPGTEPVGYVPPHREEREVPVLQNVNYIGLIPYLIAGWQDSDRRIAGMEADMAALR